MIKHINYKNPHTHEEFVIIEYNGRRYLDRESYKSEYFYEEYAFSSAERDGLPWIIIPELCSKTRYYDLRLCEAWHRGEAIDTSLLKPVIAAVGA